MELIVVCFCAVVWIMITISQRKIKLEEEREQIRKNEREKKLRKSGILEVDEMSGEVFEQYVKSLLKMRGYNVRLTKASGDYGADLILTTNDKIIAVQVKRYKNKVGLKAVQEVVSAKSYYGADECWVITNNYFTSPAKSLGMSNGVNLIDRDELIEWMTELKKNEEANII